MGKRRREKQLDRKERQLEKRAKKFADKWGAEFAPGGCSGNRDRDSCEKRDRLSDAHGEEIEESSPPAVTYDQDEDGNGIVSAVDNWLEMQDDDYGDSRSQDDFALYCKQVENLFSVAGSPPFLLQSGTIAVETVVFPLPGWDAKKKKTSAKFHTTGFARVAAPISQIESDELPEGPTVAFFCDCCEEGQLAWVDILYWFE